jgi:hypothetical protein
MLALTLGCDQQGVQGDVDEVGATVQNAAAYNGNLMKRIAMGQGTPLKPDMPVDVFVFALFNEDMKPIDVFLFTNSECNIPLE